MLMLRRTELLERAVKAMEGERGEAMVEQFKQITGMSDDTTCRGLLEAYGWDVENAASAYFDDAHGGRQPPAWQSAAPMGVHRPPERLVDPMPMLDDDDDEYDEDYQPLPLGRRLPSGVQPMDDDDEDDDKDDGADRMRAALFPGGFPPDLAARAAAAAATAAAAHRPRYVPPDGTPSEDDQLQRVLAESSRHFVPPERGADRGGADAPQGARELESALARSQQAFAQEEERLLARALAMSERAAAAGAGTEDDPLDLDDAYDPALRAAMEASVLPPSPLAPASLGGGRPARQPAPPAVKGLPSGSAANPIDADAELAASLAGGDDDDAYARHLAHPDGLEASYAHAARRSIQAHQPASARELLKQEQEREYEESLALDRAREQSMAEAAEREAAEAEAAQASVLAESRAAEAAKERARAELDAMRGRVLDEPPAGAPGVVTIAVRLPEGGRLLRRFEVGQRVGALYDYVRTAWADLSGAGAAPGEFALVSHMPRTVHDDRERSLRESGLTDRQCALFVESTV